MFTDLQQQYSKAIQELEEFEKHIELGLFRLRDQDMFFNNIQRALDVLSCDQRKLTEVLDVSESTISRWKNRKGATTSQKVFKLYKTLLKECRSLKKKLHKSKASLSAE